LGSFKLQDEKQIRFWEDKWLGANALRDDYPNLYNIVRRKNATVDEILHSQPLNVSFRRSLVAANLYFWNHLVLRLAHIHLRECANIFRWSLKHDGKFSVYSMYQALVDSDVVPHNSYLWKFKIPLKIRLSYGYYIERQYSPKIILSRWIGMEMRCVVFVVITKLYNTSFLIVWSLNLYGE
jgi:hypothetical protein